jgi:hypothetical protein
MSDSLYLYVLPLTAKPVPCITKTSSPGCATSVIIAVLRMLPMAVVVVVDRGGVTTTVSATVTLYSSDILDSRRQPVVIVVGKQHLPCFAFQYDPLPHSPGGLESLSSKPVHLPKRRGHLQFLLSIQ